MDAVWRHVSHAMGPSGGHGSYALPDALFVVNVADNMHRVGRGTRAPILSLQVGGWVGGQGSSWAGLRWSAAQWVESRGPGREAPI